MGLIFKPLKKKPKYGRSPGTLMYMPENIKHVCWCMDNGISIAVSPNWKNSGWMVEVKMKGEVNTDPAEYTDEEALRKMYEYYEYYYNKYNEDKI